MRTRFCRLRPFITAVVALAVGLAGVPASAAAEPVTINMHVMGSETGGLFPVLADVTKGVKAAESAIEKRGDITFDVTYCDAGGDSNALRKCGEDAVADHADVVVSADIGQVASGLVDILEDARIPAFYLIATGNEEAQATNSMMPNISTLATFGAIGVGAAKQGFKKDAVVVNSPISENVTHMAAVGYEAMGGKIKATIDDLPFVIPGAANPPDLTPYAQRVVDEDPKIVIDPIGDLLQPLRALGYAGPIVIADAGSSTLTEQLRELPPEVTNDLYRASQQPPFDLVKDLPVTKQFKKQMAAVDEGDVDDLTTPAAHAWKVLYAISEQVKTMSGDITGPGLTDAFNSSKGIKLVTGETWVPSAAGPPTTPRASLLAYWFSKYVGDGKWKLVKTPRAGNIIASEVFADL